MSGIKGANKPRTHVNDSLLTVTALPDSVDWCVRA